MILPFIASNQSLGARAAGSPNRSITRRTRLLGPDPAQQLVVVGATEVVGQLVEDVPPQAGRFVMPRRGQVGREYVLIDI